MAKLTERQRKRLLDIAAYRPTPKWPYAAFWKASRTDQSLVTRGLIERIDHETTLGGGGTAGGLTAIWHLCRLTPAGRAILEDRDNG